MHQPQAPSPRSRHRRRANRAVVGLLIAPAIGATMVVGVVAPAYAADPPPNPSDGQISAAAQQKAAVASQVGQLSSEVAGAQSELRQLQAAQEMAEQKVAYSVSLLRDAKSAATRAQAGVSAAQRRVDAAREDYAAFAEANYTSGTIGGTTGTLLTAPDPNVVLEQSALQDYESEHQIDAISSLDTATIAKSNADAVARAAVAKLRRLTDAANRTAHDASAAVLAGRAREQQLTATLQSDQQALEQAQLQLATLNDQRAQFIAYQQEQARLKAERERRARLLQQQMLERQRKLEQQQREQARIQQQKLVQQRKLEEQQRIQQQKLEQQRKLEEQQRKLEEQQKLEQQRKLEEQQRKLDEQKKLAQQKLEDQQKLEQQRKLEEQQRKLDEQKKKLEQQQKLQEQQREQQQQKLEQQQKQLQQQQQKLQQQKEQQQKQQQNQGGGSGGSGGSGNGNGNGSGGGSGGSGGGSHETAGWTAAKGEDAVSRAMKYLGTMYAWAGGDANGPTYGVCSGDGAWNDCHIRGFDCSGLSLYAWAPYLNLPHYSVAQYSEAGSVHPSTSQLMPGDLTFWSSNGSSSGIHHVAIYIGGGNVIQAPQSGDVIKITPLVDVDWGYLGATRPLT